MTRCIGLVVPSSNTTAEIEFRQQVPEGTSIHAGRMALESVTVDELDAMSSDAARAAELLGHAAVDAVFVSCTNYRSMAAIERLEADLGVPVITSNGATLWDVCRVAGLEVDGPGAVFDLEG